MKKLITTIAACALPLALASPLNAQTSKSPDPQASPYTSTTTPDNSSKAAMPSTGASAGAPATGAPATPPAAEPAKKESTQAISGWSVKNSFIGKAVHNEADEKIGDISDVVLSADGKAVYFIVGAGGFLGLGERNVAIPYEKITRKGDKLVLPGFSKDQLKALPKVEIAK